MNNKTTGISSCFYLVKFVTAFAGAMLLMISTIA